MDRTLGKTTKERTHSWRLQKISCGRDVYGQINSDVKCSRETAEGKESFVQGTGSKVLLWYTHTDNTVKRNFSEATKSLWNVEGDSTKSGYKEFVAWRKRGVHLAWSTVRDWGRTRMGGKKEIEEVWTVLVSWKGVNMYFYIINFVW
jgi:hypothetical protein